MNVHKRTSSGSINLDQELMDAVLEAEGLEDFVPSDRRITQEMPAVQLASLASNMTPTLPVLEPALPVPNE